MEEKGKKLEKKEISWTERWILKFGNEFGWNEKIYLGK